MVRKGIRAKSKKVDIVAVKGERNMDYLFDESISKGTTIYFDWARGKVELDMEHPNHPGFILNKVEKYVLGTSYIWIKKVKSQEKN